MKIKRKNRLTMKDFFKLPDDVQDFLVMLAEEHGISLKSYLKRCPPWGLGWCDGEKEYGYKRGLGVIQTHCENLKGGKIYGKENEEDFGERFSEEC